MKILCLTLALLTSAAICAHAQEVILLPEDGGLWHTTIVLPQESPTDTASLRLVEHFTRSPRLQKLSIQTSLHRYTPSDPLFSARYAPYFGGIMPALLVQKADGTIVYKVSGEAIPTSSEKLADEIAQAIDQCCPLRPKPQPSPQPSPQPTPQPSITPILPDVHVDLVPDIRPQVEEPDAAPTQAPASPPMSPLVLLAPIVAAALGFRRTARRAF